MADCDDRQLTEAQRQAGYQNQRTGVMQALRPFTGRPTLQNLLDYLNRELVPAVRAVRGKVNDIYLPAVDNAPSGNPLQYYFSTDTTNADPTAGRVRFDASPQDTATTIRVSEQNARLGDARPWLEVMAGGATTPLGVVTVTDAVNPGRFIRFDLDTMVDQGSYWDLGVTVIESSDDDPFADGGGLVVSFIPGVASDGVTVPATSLTPIAGLSVLGTSTTATAAPAAITMPVTTGGRFLRTNTTGYPSTNPIAPSIIGWGTLTNLDLQPIPDLRFLANISGASAPPAQTDFAQLAQDLFGIGWDSTTHNFRLSDVIDNTFMGNISGATTYPHPTSLSDLDSISITYENVGKSFIREALFGDVVALQNNNETTIQPNVITDAKLRDSLALSVIGRSANSTGDPADIQATAASSAVLRESGSVLGFGTVVNAGLADMTAGTFKGRQVTSSTGPPEDMTGSQASGALRYNGGLLTDTASTGSITSYNPTGFTASVTGVRITPTGNTTLLGMALNTGQSVVLRVGRTSAFTVTINHEDGTATAAERFNTPNNVAIVLRAGEAVLIRNTEGRNNIVSMARTTVSDADYGDITVSSNGSVWTIDNDVVSDAKLRNSAALSVIGRSANSTGDPADIAGTASSDAILRISGTTLGFGTIATAGIADDQVTNAKLANMAEGTVKGRAVLAGTGDPTDLTGTQAAGLLRYPPLIDTTSSGTVTTYAPTGFDASITNIRVSPTADLILRGMVLVNGQGISIRVGRGSAFTVTLNHEDGSAAAATERFNCPNNANLVLRAGEACMLRAGESRNNVVATAKAGVNDADYGDITVTTSGTTWTIDNNVISDAKLRDSSALSVIGRSVNSVGDPSDIATTSGSNSVLVESGGVLAFGLITTNNILDNTVGNADLRQSAALSVVGRTNNTLGNVADISATAASDAVLRESGSTLSFGQIATGGIADDAVTNGKLRNGGALSVIGRSANSTGDVADISGTASSDQVLRISGTTLGFGTIATAGIADDAVTDAKLRNSGALSVIGRSANSTGDPADISGTASSDAVLRISGTALGFGTVATAGIAANAVTNAKLATMAQSRIKGRAESAGTGDPTDLTPTEVASIIDGETITWTGSHTFNGTNNTFGGTNLTVSTSNNVTIGAAATLTLSGSTVAQITSPARIASSLALDSVTSSASTAANDLSIGSVNVVRFTGPIDPLTGMIPAVDGQTVLLVNAHASTNMGIHIESASSSAANRFAGTGTSRVVRPGEMALAWYDGTSDRWRLLLRDDIDL